LRRQARAAEERGAAMSLATATEYALMLAADPQPPAEEVRAGPGPAPAGAVRHGLTANEATAGLARLSPRERELVTLIAQGRTDA
jgi:DNA-binding NarL/FixJ family response regulator